ncbi:MAG: hypothetical protein AAB663_00390 [Patescibacteria group bacterium]
MHSKIQGRVVILVGENEVANAALVQQTAGTRTEGSTFVTLLTTRLPHADDWPGSYRYVTQEQFDRAVTAGSFVLHYAHDGHAYGIRMYDLDEALREGTVVLTLPRAEAEKLRGMVDHAYVVPVASTPTTLDPESPTAVDQLTAFLSRLSR